MTQQEKVSMKEMIIDEISDECCKENADNNFDCENCCDLEQCYVKACQKSSHEFAEALDYGGYDTEEEFWENLD